MKLAALRWTASRIAASLFLVASLAGFVNLESLLAPSAEPWPRFEAHASTAGATIDHTPWARFLETYARAGGDGIARVAYGAVTEGDEAQLHAYLDFLRRQPIGEFSRAEQLAFWINLYNATTVRLVLEHYPVASIRDIDISGGLFSHGPWDRKLMEVDGEPVSLNDFEHRILRPIWKDPRLHYAVNCAALGCPNLVLEPFTAENADRLLDQAARDYVNHPRGVRADGDGVTVSKIYAWYAEDFGGSEVAVLTHIRAYADAALAEYLLHVDSINGYEYDWALNATPTPGN